jgi:CDP-diacylglycerol--glycerol-3-phosphate 3-phosphatidyltransferase
MICFSTWEGFPAWTVIVIVAREFIVSGFRLAVVAKNNKAVIAADIWGKIKTAFTMLSLGALLWICVMFQTDILHFAWLSVNAYNISLILMYICTALTVFSGITMIYKNRKLFSE